jgi:hypothetical protein
MKKSIENHRRMVRQRRYGISVFRFASASSVKQGIETRLLKLWIGKEA